MSCHFNFQKNILIICDFIYIYLKYLSFLVHPVFRCRSNYMPVSKAYKHVTKHDTKCKICDKNEIGDEFHYLFMYPVFQKDLTRLAKKYYRKFPSMYKCI